MSSRRRLWVAVCAFTLNLVLIPFSDRAARTLEAAFHIKGGDAEAVDRELAAPFQPPYVHRLIVGINRFPQDAVSASGLVGRLGLGAKPDAPIQRIEGSCRDVLMRLDKLLAAAATIVVTTAMASVYAYASGLEGDATALAVLQTKADQAPLRDKCFLYAKLVGQLAERAGQQLSSGDGERASESLELLRQYAVRMGSAITDDSRKMKDAELITRRATFRLRSVLRGAPYEDRPDWDATLKLLFETQTNLMMHVFKR
jgi:hypothetical protein